MWDCINNCGRQLCRPRQGVCRACGEPVTFPGDIASRFAEQLAALLSPACGRVCVAGSIRRQRSRVKDIEIVAEPYVETMEGQRDLFSGDVIPERTRLDTLLPELIQDGRIERDHERKLDGPRQKRLRYTTHSIPVDLFIVRPPAQWGVIYTIRTGPAEFSKALVSNLPAGMRVKDGQLFRGSTLVPTAREKDFFAAVNLPYCAPMTRRAETVYDFRRMAARTKPKR